MAFYRVKKEMHDKTYQGVLNYLSPLKDFLCNSAYHSLTDVLANTSDYKGDGKVPTKIPMGGGYDYSFTLHEYSHMIEFAMRNKAYRIGRHGFGFTYPKDNMGYDCPTKPLGTLCELKTVAIMGRILYQFRNELNLSLYDIINQIVYDIEAIMSFVGDSFLFEYDTTFWGGIDRKSLDYRRRKQTITKQAFRYVLLCAGNMSWGDIETANKRVKKFVEDKHKRMLKNLNSSGETVGKELLSFNT